MRAVGYRSQDIKQVNSYIMFDNSRTGPTLWVLQGYLSVRGAGYRRARKGHPLPNIYRQWCDARAQPCIVIQQGMGESSSRSSSSSNSSISSSSSSSSPAGGNDLLMVDLATLRQLDVRQVGVNYVNRWVIRFVT